MRKILVFDKGGRDKRINLIKNKKAPRDFLYSIDFLNSNGFNIQHLSSIKKYKRNFIFVFGRIFEQIFSKITNVGIRPLAVFQFRKIINNSDYVVSLTDGFSVSLGFYYSFINKNIYFIITNL